jgi:hypothetical protein
VSSDARQQRRIRRNAIGLAVLAAAVYVGYFIMMLGRPGG